MVKSPAADATDAPQSWGLLCNPVLKMISFFTVLPISGAQLEWNLERKTEVIGEKPVPVPLCRLQIPHGLIRDRTRVSAVRARRLTAWVMARPRCISSLLLLSDDNEVQYSETSVTLY
jgi:hypothetical protein